MQIIRDIGQVRRRRRQSRLLTFIGLVLLLGALFASNVLTGIAPEMLTLYLLASYVALVGGFICFNAGLQGVAKWSRRPRRDEVLDNHLKRLDDRFTVFHYATIGGKLVDHIAVHTGGVTVMVVRDSFGPITYQNGRWHRRASLLARLFNFAGPPVGNPHADAETTIKGVSDHLHSQGLVAPVDAVIVFVNPRAVLTVDESPIPICRVEDVAGLIRERAGSRALSGGQRLQVVRLLTAGVGEPDEPATRSRRGRERRGAAEAKQQRRSN